MSDLLPGERLDSLLRGGLSILQNPGRTFCFGTDAVLLAYFASQGGGSRFCDIGTGVGILPLLLSQRLPQATFAAIDIQQELCDMASRSVARNGLTARIDVRCLDARGAHRALGANAFDCVVCNPPYGKAGSTTVSENEAHLIARHEVHGTLRDLVHSASQLLRFGGRLCMVHKAARLPELLCAMREYHLEPKRLQCVHDRLSVPAKLVLAEGHKGGGEGLHVLPPLVLREEDGGPTAKYREIYDEG